ncbi:MAG TPA: prolipoprotein diacylglyceryl transferase family protein [Acidimicrobiia bacterium]
MEFTLLWAALTAAVMGWLGTKLWNDGLPENVGDRLLGAAVAGLLLGRVTAMIVQGTNPLSHPGDVLVVRGGVDMAAASIGAISVFMTSVGWQIRYLDATAPAILFGLAGWHGGCLWREACLGTASALPWAWADAGSLVTRHPVELYAALAMAGLAWAASRLQPRPFLRSGIALAGAGLIRLATQPLRLSLSGGPVGWYIAAIAIGLLAALLGPRVATSTGRGAT